MKTNLVIPHIMAALPKTGDMMNENKV